MAKRKIHKPTGCCLNCGKKLSEKDYRKIYCSIRCQEDYYYRKVVLPKRKEHKKMFGAVPNKKEMIDNIAQLLNITPNEVINETYKAIILKLEKE
mgnify:CR=1 FL=1